jgi:hypothetical protein
MTGATGAPLCRRARCVPRRDGSPARAASRHVRALQLHGRRLRRDDRRGRARRRGLCPGGGRCVGVPVPHALPARGVPVLASGWCATARTSACRRCAATRSARPRQICQNGRCVDQCAGLMCTGGQVCNVRDGRARCVENNCYGLGCRARSSAARRCASTTAAPPPPARRVSSAGPRDGRGAVRTRSCATCGARPRSRALDGACVADPCQGVTLRPGPSAAWRRAAAVPAPIPASTSARSPGACAQRRARRRPLRGRDVRRRRRRGVPQRASASTRGLTPLTVTACSARAAAARCAALRPPPAMRRRALLALALALVRLDADADDTLRPTVGRCAMKRPLLLGATRAARSLAAASRSPTASTAPPATAGRQRARRRAARQRHRTDGRRAPVAPPPGARSATGATTTATACRRGLRPQNDPAQLRRLRQRCAPAQRHPGVRDGRLRRTGSATWASSTSTAMPANGCEYECSTDGRGGLRRRRQRLRRPRRRGLRPQTDADNCGPAATRASSTAQRRPA